MGAVGYSPILDTERGVMTGVAATPARGRTLDAGQLAVALADRSQLPRNTFLSVPLAWTSLDDPQIHAELLRPFDLAGIVFELIGVLPGGPSPERRDVASSIQTAGGLLALQADEIWHPDFEAIAERAPKMIVVGEGWVHRIEHSERRQSVIETLGHVAAERDAWVLAAGVSSPAELTTLTELHVPLLSGPAIGRTDFSDWPSIDPGVPAALGPQRRRPPGPMRTMLVAAPTATTMGDAAAAAMRSSQDRGCAVVLDVYRRPVALALRTASGVRVVDDPLCVHVDTALRDVATRARARGASRDPIVAIDSAGRFLGTVAVEDLTDSAPVRP